MSSDLRTLAAWSRGLTFLAAQAPRRLSSPQLAAFALAAICDTGGEPATLTLLRATLGKATGKSVHTTYSVFLKATKGRPDGLGWLAQHSSPLDGREKLLRLTPRGKRVVGTMLAAIRSM